MSLTHVFLEAAGEKDLGALCEGGLEGQKRVLGEIAGGTAMTNDLRAVTEKDDRKIRLLVLLGIFVILVLSAHAVVADSRADRGW